MIKPMSVRCLMVVSSVTHHHYSAGVTVGMTAHYDTNIPEDVRFAKATPNGSLQMFADNPAAAKEFAIGRKFYLDFSPVEPIQET